MSPLPFAITGGIACGKSSLAKILTSLGWSIIDSDHIVHELYSAGGAGQKKVVDLFGESLLNGDGSVNRSALGQLVFTDSKLRLQLNSLIHPLVKEQWLHQYKNLVQRTSQIVLVIPLLFEAGLESDFQNIACVGCPRHLQETRLVERGLTALEAKLRIESQQPLELKMEKSHRIIWNAGCRDHLHAQALRLHNLWLNQ